MILGACFDCLLALDCLIGWIVVGGICSCYLYSLCSLFLLLCFVDLCLCVVCLCSLLWLVVDVCLFCCFGWWLPLFVLGFVVCFDL